MTTVNLPNSLVESAKIAAAAAHRSMPKQIEHWAVLGKAAEDNPDLPLTFIKDILEAKAEIESGVELEEYKFGPL